jgi:glucose dehydrogenase
VKRRVFTAGLASVFSLATCAAAAQVSSPQSSDRTFADWPSYGGDPGGSRYSPLTQINRTNVAQLKIAWEYHTGDRPVLVSAPRATIATEGDVS